jgi:hypothetical protein
MGEVTVALIVLAAFFAAMAYVIWCGRLTGPDPEDIEMGAGFADLATTEVRPHRRARRARAARSARHERRGALAPTVRPHR